MSKKILVIDDEIEICESVKIRLEANGYDVMMVENGSQGLETMTSYQPDLVLLDITMPGMSGLDVCQEIKSNAEMKGIPVVIFTAHVNETYEILGQAAGADAYIKKPFEARDLLATIAQLI